jgi:hypothetical protein
MLKKLRVSRSDAQLTNGVPILNMHVMIYYTLSIFKMHFKKFSLDYFHLGQHVVLICAARKNTRSEPSLNN